MKSKLLLGIMITVMIAVTGCSNDTEVVNADDIPNSNTIEQNDSLENNQEVIKSNVKEYTAIPPSSNEKNVTKQQDDIKIESIPVGSYIKYQPSSTSCTVLAEDSGYENNQTYNPSTITSWKVFKNNNGQLDIISSESVGDLTLQGEIGYTKGVGTLNKMCEEYINPLYAVSGRCLGYVSGTSIDSIDINTFPLTWEYTYEKRNIEYPYADDNYLADQAVINTKVDTNRDETEVYPLHHSNGYIWFASRNLRTSSDLASFSMRTLLKNGSYGGDGLQMTYSDNSIKTYTRSNGVRPVISLKHGIKITGGEGTKDNPYAISM